MLLGTRQSQQQATSVSGAVTIPSHRQSPVVVVVVIVVVVVLTCIPIGVRVRRRGYPAAC